MKPQRIQRKRTKGFKLPENTIYVGRPTKWGNPFKGKDAVEKYKNFITTILKIYKATGKNVAMGYSLDIEGLKELRGKNLACWCPLDKECHADVLLELLENLEE